MRNRMVVCWAGALGLLGCGVTEPPVDRLVVTTSVSVLEMHPGGSAEITIRATNPTPRVLEFATNSCVLVPFIVDSEGEEVYPGGVPCFDILILHSLSPGESLEESFTFDGFGRTDWRGGSEAYALPPGTYWVRGAVGSHRDNPSKPVSLVVRAPPE